jgi:hypothetical protein
MALPGKRSNLPATEIDLLENKLEKMLSLRQANPEFVTTLRHRLTSQPTIQVETRKRYKAWLILAAALFSGGLIVFVISLLFGRSGKSIS